MASDLDKFTYTTTYRQDYCKNPYGDGSDPSVGQGAVECKGRHFASADIPPRYAQTSLNTCKCQAGGSLPTRGAEGHGQATNLGANNPCGCPPPVTNMQPKLTKEEMAEMVYKAIESGALQGAGGSCGPCSGKPDLNPMRGPMLKQPDISGPCPGAVQLRPQAPGKYGGQFEGPLNMPPRHPDQTQPYAFNTPCECLPSRKPVSGPQDYGKEWTRIGTMGPKIEPTLIGKEKKSARDGGRCGMPEDLDKLVRPEPPAARVGCAPQSDVSKFDQPNTFMKKLYERYPYLYQILRDTPPEELIAKVFRDRFLTTYQVDYLHMGVGKEAFPKGGLTMDEKYKGPDGDEEPSNIPGCSFRYNQKAEFGKKKSSLIPAKDWDRDDFRAPVIPPKRVSEYMDTVSKLGGQIMKDKLYELERMTKKMMKEYPNYEAEC